MPLPTRVDFAVLVAFQPRLEIICEFVIERVERCFLLGFAELIEGGAVILPRRLLDAAVAVPLLNPVFHEYQEIFLAASDAEFSQEFVLAQRHRTRPGFIQPRRNENLVGATQRIS